jgi:hypothetical protein
VASPLSEGGGAGRQLSPQPPNRSELIGVNDVGGTFFSAASIVSFQIGPGMLAPNTEP